MSSNEQNIGPGNPPDPGFADRIDKAAKKVGFRIGKLMVESVRIYAKPQDLAFSLAYSLSSISDEALVQLVELYAAEHCVSLTSWKKDAQE